MELIWNEELYQRVVREGILRAERSLLIATANLKNIHIPWNRRRVKSIVQILYDLAETDVFIQVLHSSEPSASFWKEAREEGLLDHPNFTMFHCPRSHFKAVIVDEEWMYLGSANLTGAGFGAKSEKKRNFECGIMTRHQPSIKDVIFHFTEIFEGKHCPGCYYRKKGDCPGHRGRTLT